MRRSIWLGNATFMLHRRIVSCTQGQWLIKSRLVRQKENDYRCSCHRFRATLNNMNQSSFTIRRLRFRSFCALLVACALNGLSLGHAAVAAELPNDGKLRIICFGAHPDDCEL